MITDKKVKQKRTEKGGCFIMRSAKMKWELALLLIGLAVFHPTAVKGKGSAEEFAERGI